MENPDKKPNIISKLIADSTSLSKKADLPNSVVSLAGDRSDQMYMFDGHWMQVVCTYAHYARNVVQHGA